MSVLGANRSMRLGAALVAAYALVALLGWSGLLAPGFAVQHAGQELAGPSAAHPLGTDILGRDVLARTLHGARIALLVGLVAAGLAVALGTLLGALAGWFGGRLDDAVVWLCSSVASVPSILLILLVSAMLGRGLVALLLAIALASWVGVCRLVRAEVLRLREFEFVAAARAQGARAPGLLARHIAPNLAPLILVQFTLHFAFAIKTEAIVTFLGVGLEDEPSWGVMLDQARDELIRGAWWQLGAATAALFGLVLGLQLLGDALRDALDPEATRA